MSEPEQSRVQQLLGDFAPKMVSLTDDVLFGDIWERAELSPRDRSLELAVMARQGDRPATLENPARSRG